jgi:cation diffusion facilitator CzcD-associated flavoprotein CzcO
MMRDNLPVAVVGAGPIGLAAAAHLLERGLPVKLYEAGPTVATSVRDWGHVRLFSPWKYTTDPAARTILRRNGWQEPPADAFPTGGDLYEAYLEPLAETPEMRAIIETGATVKAISRRGADKVVTNGRDTRPFELLVANGAGSDAKPRAPSSTPRAPGERPTHWGPVGYPRKARRSTRIKSPTACLTCSGATALSTRVA